MEDVRVMQAGAEARKELLAAERELRYRLEGEVKALRGQLGGQQVGGGSGAG
jgi:hypothetical protein